jgi:hypothetical protein
MLNVTLDEFHRKSFYVGSAMAAGMVLALVTGSHPVQLQDPHYVYEVVGSEVCIVDEDSGTLAPSPDGMPLCYPVSKGEGDPRRPAVFLGCSSCAA